VHCSLWSGEFLLQGRWDPRTELQLCPFRLLWRRRCSSVSIVSRLRSEGQGFNSRQGEWTEFSLCHRVQTVCGTHPTSDIQWVLGSLSPSVKRPGRESDNPSQSTAEITTVWSYTSIPPYFFMAWCLDKRRNNFIFTASRHKSSVGFILALCEEFSGMKDFHIVSRRHHVQTRSGGPLTLLSTGLRVLHPALSAGGVWGWPFTSMYCRGWECVELYLLSPAYLQGVVLC
jgi:hypothetical protein